MLSIASAFAAFPPSALANDKKFWIRDRNLYLYRPASRERKNIKFFQNGKYIQDAYKQLCWMFRDVKDNNSVTAINISLINLLFAQQQYLRDHGRSNPIIILHSGYRTKRHNNSLENAAKNSKHLTGDAADFHIEQASLNELLMLARLFKVGGIGTYSTFIHNDIGRYREWQG
jgi:Uncharacterized protein conserved in bacteria